MKYCGLIFLILFFISCAGGKNEPEKGFKPNSGETDFAQFDFETEAHDFRKVTSGERLLYSFVFTNRGNIDLHILKAEADCGCLSVKSPKEPVRPGKKGIIEVEFDSAGMVGNQLKTVELHSNCKEPKHLIIFAQVDNEEIEIK